MGDNYGVQIERLELELSAARRELAQARAEAIAIADSQYNKRIVADSVRHLSEDYLLGYSEACDDIVSELKSPAQGATSTAPQAPQAARPGESSAKTATPAAAAPSQKDNPLQCIGHIRDKSAAVPDDPVVVFRAILSQEIGCANETGITNPYWKEAAKKFAAHYEARGVRKAAEICGARARSKPLSGSHSHSQIARMECGLLAVDIERAAADLERKP